MYRLELPTSQGRCFWTGSGFSDWLYEARIYLSASAANKARQQLVKSLRRPNVSDWAKSRDHLAVVEHRSEESCSPSTILTRIPVPTVAATGGQLSDPFGSVENLSNPATKETPDNGSAALNVPDPVTGGELVDPPERKILELKAERARLLREGIRPGWIEPYTVTRQNKCSGGLFRKDGKPRKSIPSERVYTYHHYVWWDVESGSERRKHLSNRQLETVQAAIERRRRVEQIEAELRRL